MPGRRAEPVLAMFAAPVSITLPPDCCAARLPVKRRPDHAGKRRKGQWMSELTRREKIEAMLAEDPSDTFLRYSLAMELQKEGQYDRSLAGFQELMGDSPPHVPAFFMGAKLLVELDRRDEARQLLRDGIEQARKQNDAHAAGEMAEMLTALGSQG